jgi:DNA-binding SARP family transcriptional activator
MELGVLGPLRVADGDRVVDVGTSRQRHILLMLAIARGRPVSAESLIDQLWGGAPPASATGTLHGYVAHLRRALEPDRAPRSPARILVSAPTGYLLAGVELDVDRFEQWTREGRARLDHGDPAAAAERLRDALGLWRGAPLADAGGALWAAAEVTRLENLHLAAAEDLADAALALGEHDHLVAELHGLQAAHPLRERLRGQLMLALYRSGRQADALALARDGRALLAEELGIDPSPALQELESAILRQDPRLRAPSGERTAPSSPSAPIGPRGTAAAAGAVAGAFPFVGRDDELAQLAAALERARAGVGQVLLVSGEPGIGKTRLVEELTRRAAPSRVAVGRCVEAEGVPPFWPWLQILGALPSTVGCDLDPSEEFAGVGAVRFGQALRVADVLRRAGTEGGVAVVCEDLQWADQASLELLRLVAGQLVGDPVLLVATYREDGIVPGGVVEAALGILARHPAVTRLRLDGLDDPAVSALAEVVTGVAPDLGAARVLRERTSGNPYFVTEVLRWGSGDDRGTRLPAGVRDVLRLRLRALPAAGLAGLTVGAVIGRDFALHLVEAATEDPPDELLSALEAGTRAGLLTEPAPGRFRFAHALVREVLLDELSGARKARLHARVLEAMSERQGSHVPVQARAHHAYAAASAGVDVPDAAGACLAAALDDLGRSAYEDAVTEVDRGLEIEAAGPSDLGLRTDLLLARVEALTRLGDLVTAGEDLDAALEAARELGDPHRLARAAVASGGGGLSLLWTQIWASNPDIASTRELLATAHVAAPQVDPDTRLAVAALLGVALAMEGQAGAADAVSRQALEEARSRGGTTLSRALRGRLASHWGLDDPSERLQLAEELLADTPRDLRAELVGRFFRMYALLELGDAGASDAEFARFESLSPQLGSVEHQLAAGWFRVQRLLLRGEVEEAERQTQDLLRHRSGATDLAAMLLGAGRDCVHSIAAWFRGTTASVPHASIEGDARTVAGAAAALAWAAGGAVAAAAARLAASVPLGMPVDLDGPHSVALAWLHAELAVLVADMGRAAVLFDALAPWSDRVVVLAPDTIALGSAERVLGGLAALRGDLDEAVRRLSRATEVDARIGARPFEAMGHARLVEVLRARNGDGDGERVTGHAAAARRIADELGLPGVAVVRPMRRAPSAS